MENAGVNEEDHCCASPSFFVNHSAWKDKTKHAFKNQPKDKFQSKWVDQSEHSYWITFSMVSSFFDRLARWLSLVVFCFDGLKMSWARLTKKLNRSRSTSTFSIKSKSASPALSEEAVNQISTVLGTVQCVLWPQCMEIVLYLVLLVTWSDILTTQRISLSDFYAKKRRKEVTMIFFKFFFLICTVQRASHFISWFSSNVQIFQFHTIWLERDWLG